MKQEKEINKYKNQEYGKLFNGRYISKDKIRDKIKNEEKEIKEIEYLQKIDNTMALCEEKAYRQHKIDILNELLEGGKDVK